jgi:hypothetical protein
MGTAKNKLLTPVTSFTPENVTFKPPHSPRKPPQIYHPNAMFFRSFSAKPPAKTRKLIPKKSAIFSWRT